MRIFIPLLTTLVLLAAHAGADMHAAGETETRAEEPDVAARPPLEPTTQNGVEFLSGGVGDREQNELLVLDSEYNLRLATTNAEGAYLHGVQVTIENTEGRTLVDTTTRGPILLAELEPGRYVVRANLEGRTEERRVIDVPKSEEQTRLYVTLEDTGS